VGVVVTILIVEYTTVSASKTKEPVATDPSLKLTPERLHVTGVAWATRVRALIAKRILAERINPPIQGFVEFRSRGVAGTIRLGFDF
jgi:hypothetical protein